ncbi:MAG: hypothetical protein JWO59_1861 [Chloroflexi bacterium]|nr:hypothetical protein [Chloroflexota bacterium]
MANYVQQVECLQCFNYRSFVHHTEASQRRISQGEVRRLDRKAVITCDRCGTASLILGWSDAVLFASAGLARRASRGLRGSGNGA